MEKILTAKELFDKMISENDEATSTEMMIEFAKLHVQAALEAASNKAVEIQKPTSRKYVSKKELKDSYPLTNIK